MRSNSQLSNDDDLQVTEASPWPSSAHRRAFVTVLTSDSYVEGALVLATSLRAVDTKFPLVVLHTNHVADASHDRLVAAFDHVHHVDPICVDDPRLALLNGRPELRSSFTKLRAWTMVQYDRVVLLDADTLVLRNVDDLLDRAQLSAAPDAGWPDMFNSGVMVIEPSLATFRALRDELSSHGSLDGGDQGLLNQFFGTAWRANPAQHLPFTDNVTPSQNYMCIPALRAFGEAIRIVHFIGRVKPWHCRAGPNGHIVTPGPVSEDLRLLVQRWWTVRAILTDMEERHQQWAWRQMVTTSTTSTTTTTSWSSNSSWSRGDSWWAQYPRPSSEVIPFSYLDPNASRPPRRHRKRKDPPKPKPVVRPPHAMILPISSMAWATADPASGLRRRRRGALEPVIAPDLVPRPTSMVVDDPRVPSSVSSAASDSTSSWSSDSESDDDGDWRVLPRTPPPSPALDPVADDHGQDLATLEQRLVRYMLMTTITTTVEATTTESTALVSRQDHFWRLQWDTTYLTTTECRWGIEHYGVDETSGPVIPARVDSLIASMLEQRRKQEQQQVVDASSPTAPTSLSSVDMPSAPLSSSTLDGWDIDPFLPQTPPPTPASVAADSLPLGNQTLTLAAVEQKLVHYVLMTTVTTTVETTTTMSSTYIAQDEHFWRLKWDTGYLTTPTAVWGLEHYGADEASGPVIPQRVDSLIASMLEQQRKQQALQRPTSEHPSPDEHFGRVKWDGAYLTTDAAKWGLEHYGVDETSGPVIPERVDSLIASLLEQKRKQQAHAAPATTAPPSTAPSGLSSSHEPAELDPPSSSVADWGESDDSLPPPPPPSPASTTAEPPLVDHALNQDALEGKLVHYVLVTKVTTTAETTTTTSTNVIAQDEHFWRLKWDAGYLTTPTAAWGLEHYGIDKGSGPVIPERVDSLIASMLEQQRKQQTQQKPSDAHPSPDEHFGRIKWDDEYLTTETAKWGLEHYGVDETSGPVIPQRVESLIASMLEQKRKLQAVVTSEPLSPPTAPSVPIDTLPLRPPNPPVAGSDAVHDTLAPPTGPSTPLGSSDLALLALSSSSISALDDGPDFPPPPPPSPVSILDQPLHMLNSDALEEKLAHYVLMTKVTTTAETTTTTSTNVIAQDEHFWRLKWDAGYLTTPTAAWGLEHYGTDANSGPVLPERVDSLIASMLEQQHKKASQKPAEQVATVISPEEHFGRVKWDDQYLATNAAKWGIEMYGVDEASGPVISERVESLIASMLEQRRKQEELDAAAAALAPTNHGVAPSRPAADSETGLGKPLLASSLDSAPAAGLTPVDHDAITPLVADSEIDLGKPLIVPALEDTLASKLGPADHNIAPLPLAAGSDADLDKPFPAPSLDDALANHLPVPSPPLIPDRDSSLVASAMMDRKDSRLSESDLGAGAALALRPAGPEDSSSPRPSSWNVSSHASTTSTDLVEQNPFHLAPASHYSWPAGEFDDALFDRFSAASQLVPSIPETNEPDVQRPPLLLRPRLDKPGAPPLNLDAPATSVLWPDDETVPLPMKPSASSNFAELDHDESTKHAVLAWLLKTHQAGSGSSSSAPTARLKPGAVSEPVLSTGSSPASSVGDAAEWEDVDDDDAPLPLRTSYGSLPRPRPASRIRFDGLPGNLVDKEDLGPVAISIPEPSEPNMASVQQESDDAVIVHVAESVASNDYSEVAPSLPDLVVPIEPETTGVPLALHAPASQPTRYQIVTTTTTTAVTTTSTTATTSALTQAETATHKLVETTEPRPSVLAVPPVHDLAAVSGSGGTRPSMIYDTVEELSDGIPSPTMSNSTDNDGSVFSDVLDLYGTVPRPTSPEVKEPLPAVDLSLQSPSEPVAQVSQEPAHPELAESRANRIKSVALAIRLLQRKRADMAGKAAGQGVLQAGKTEVAQDTVAAVDPATTLTPSTVAMTGPDSAPVVETTSPPSDDLEPAVSAGSLSHFGGVVYPDHGASPTLDVVASPHEHEPSASLQYEPHAAAPTARIKSVMAAMRLLQRKRAQLDPSADSAGVSTTLDQPSKETSRPALTSRTDPENEPDSFAPTGLDAAQLPPTRLFDTMDSLRVDDAGHAASNEYASIFQPASPTPLSDAVSLPVAPPSKDQSFATLDSNSDGLLPPPPRRGQSRLKSSALAALAATRVTSPSAESFADTASSSAADTAPATATTSLVRLPDPLDGVQADHGAEHDSKTGRTDVGPAMSAPALTMDESLPPPPRRGQSRFKSAALATAIGASHTPRRHSSLSPSIDATNIAASANVDPMALGPVPPLSPSGGTTTSVPHLSGQPTTDAAPPAPTADQLPPPPPRRQRSSLKTAGLAVMGARMSSSSASSNQEPIGVVQPDPTSKPDHSLPSAALPPPPRRHPTATFQSSGPTDALELVEVRPPPGRPALPGVTAPKPALDSPPPRRHTRPPRPSRPLSELTTPPTSSPSGPSKPDPTATTATTAPAVIVPSRPVSPSTSLSRLSVTEKMTVSSGKVTTPVRRPTAPSAPTETDEPEAAAATPPAPPLVTRLPSSGPFVSVQRLWQDGTRWRGVVAIVLIAGTAIAVLGLLVGLPFLLVFAA
ncbi:Glycogenin-1 [Allomyces arbusculus]|nr:Glycogenin-1 [Allomyces arbusculus]